jgi:hypothetical protein
MTFGPAQIQNVINIHNVRFRCPIEAKTFGFVSALRRVLRFPFRVFPSVSAK